MKTFKLLLVAVLVVVAGIGSAAADHRRPRAHVGVYFGAPLWPWYYPPYWDYPPRVVVVPAPEPPVYIEQNPAPAVQSTNYWYYCVEAKAYYPYVKDCPGGWQQVVPQAPR